MSRGDIIIVNLPQPSTGGGREQIGNRPALIVHDDTSSSVLPVIMIIPFTSQLSAQRFPHTILVQPSQTNGLSTASVLLIFQLRAIDRNRINQTIGQLEANKMARVEEELRSMLGL